VCPVSRSGRARSGRTIGLTATANQAALASVRAAANSAKRNGGSGSGDPRLYRLWPLPRSAPAGLAVDRRFLIGTDPQASSRFSVALHGQTFASRRVRSRPGDPVCALALARGSGTLPRAGRTDAPDSAWSPAAESSPLTVGSVRAMARICRATPDRVTGRMPTSRRSATSSGAWAPRSPRSWRRPPRLHRRSPVSRRQAHRRRLAKFRVACEARISHLKRRYGRSRHGSAVTHGTLPSDPPTASPSASGSSPGANLQPGRAIRRGRARPSALPIHPGASD
jgi:hypothetical protein